MRSTLRAVHREELTNYLAHIGLMGVLERGELRCASCGSVVTLANIGVILRDKDEYQVTCASERCVLCTGLRETPVFDEQGDSEWT